MITQTRPRPQKLDLDPLTV